MNWKNAAKKFVKVASVSGGALTMGACFTPTNYEPPPLPNSFVIKNNTASNPNTATLASTGTVVSLYGTVTIAGATQETVGYQESTTPYCTVTGGTIVKTIEFSIPTAFAFSPNGSFGPTTGLFDTVFTSTATGSMQGAIYNATCTVFSAAQAVYANGGSSFEYPGGGNSEVPNGEYILEIWEPSTSTTTKSR
jgi:hypothetical protein